MTGMSGWSLYRGGIPRHAKAIVQRYVGQGHWGVATVYEEFRQSAERFGDRAAIVAGQEKVTYSDLLERVERIASGLHSLGIARGDVLAAQLPNWPELVELSLASARLGACLCPINVVARREMEAMLKVTESPLLVIPATFRDFDYQGFVQSLRSRLPLLRHVFVARGQADSGFEALDALRRSPVASLPSTPDANDPWLVEFTSGTTAAPKGVVRTHNNTLFTLHSLTNFFGVATRGGDDVAIAAQPITFVFPFYLSVVMPLTNGLTTVLQDGFDPKETLRLIERHRVTFFSIVPSLVERLLEASQAGSWDLASLRVIQIGGDVVSEERKDSLMRALNCDVLECYGLTECSWPVAHPSSSSLEKKLTTSGRLCPGVELRIVDDNRRDVQRGQVGEITLRSPSLFPGYYRNPEATRQVIDDDGWFYTGDLGIKDTDGYISIVGRKKDVIVRGGVNVLPQEVEEWLTTHPKVRQAAVFGVPDPSMGEQIWACVVGHAKDVEPDELREFLRGKIASFKVPSRVFIVEELPVSGSGKLLRRQLRERMVSKLESGEGIL